MNFVLLIYADPCLRERHLCSAPILCSARKQVRSQNGRPRQTDQSIQCAIPAAQNGNEHRASPAHGDRMAGRRLAPADASELYSGASKNCEAVLEIRGLLVQGEIRLSVRQGIGRGDGSRLLVMRYALASDAVAGSDMRPTAGDGGAVHPATRAAGFLCKGVPDSGKQTFPPLIDAPSIHEQFLLDCIPPRAQ